MVFCDYRVYFFDNLFTQIRQQGQLLAYFAIMHSVPRLYEVVNENETQSRTPILLHHIIPLIPVTCLEKNKVRCYNTIMCM